MISFLEVLLLKKDGTGFYNQFFMTPLRAKGLFGFSGKPLYFIGVQTECDSKEDKNSVENACKKLRDEQAFESIDALKAQIDQDLVRAQAWFEE